MNFSKTTSYALSTLNFLAENEKEKFSAKQIHKKLDIPWPYLRQLLTSLTKSGFIISVQGRNGGFILHKSPEEITLAEIVNSVEGLNILGTCIMGFNKCPFNHTCAMHETWQETRDGMINILNNTTLAHLKKGDK